MYLILLLAISCICWIRFLMTRRLVLSKSFLESNGSFLAVFLFVLALVILGDQYTVISEVVKNLAVMLLPFFGLLLPVMKHAEISGYLGEKMKLSHFYLPGIVLVINLFSFVYMSKKTDDFLHQVIQSLMEFTFVVSVFFLLPAYFLLYSFLDVKKIAIAPITTSQRNWLRLSTLGLTICSIFFMLYQWMDGFPLFKWLVGLLIVSYCVFMGWFPFPYSIEKGGTISTQRDETRERIHAEFVRLMQQEKLYLDTKLSLRSLTKQLLSNEKYVSVYINETYGMSFTNYMNQLRIEAAKELLTNSAYDHYTMETIATMAGFHSKSTFNLAFKKEVGVTPSVFKNEARNL